MPPNWSEVRISDDPQAAMLACGRDKAGRIQYLYSAAAEASAQEEKFERVRDFAARFPTLERALLRRLAAGEQEALILLLIARAGLRIGNVRDRKGKKTVYGVATLRARHVTVTRSRIQFDFVGKQGIRNSQQLIDRRLARALAERLEGLDPQQRIFTVSDDRVRDYLHALAGDVLIKDLRTRHANLIAGKELAALAPPRSEREFSRCRRRIALSVAARLGNTPAVCLSSYIDPHLFAPWRELVEAS